MGKAAIVLSPPERGTGSRRFQMRKLILIAVMATMSTTSCYANLSLASYDPTPASVEQKAQTEPPKAEVQEIRRAATAKPEKRHFQNRARSAGRVYQPAYPAHDIYQHGCL
jgi:hypothetical protein